MKAKLLTIITLAFLTFPCYLSHAQDKKLDAYIQEGLKSSQILKQQNFQLQKAIFALGEAKTLFLPTVSFNTTYSTAMGGRKIDFPVGDLLNPVYKTLNQLTQTSLFPQIDNVSEQLVPKNFYDTRFKTTMPLINAEIKYNQSIKKEQINLQQTEIQVLKRELVKDIKSAYFNYLKSAEAIKIYENALKLLRESERVNQSLIANGSANPSVLIRTRNEISRIESEIEAAQNNKKNAAAYFNFLLNRDFTISIEEDSTYSKADFHSTINEGHREELDKLQTGININRQLLSINQSYKKPKIGASFDFGSQGNASTIFASDKNFFKPNAFFLVGISFDIPVYTFGRNQLKVKQTEMELASLNEQLIQVKNQLDLQSELAHNSYQSAKQIFESKATQLSTAERYYRDSFRRYKEGQLNFIELLDAQTQITAAQLQQSIARYDVWLRWAELERAKASYDLNQ